MLNTHINIFDSKESLGWGPEASLSSPQFLLQKLQMHVRTDLKSSLTNGQPPPCKGCDEEGSDNPPCCLQHIHCSSVTLYLPFPGVWLARTGSCALLHSLHTLKKKSQNSDLLGKDGISSHSFSHTFHPVHTPPPSLRCTMRNPTVRQQEESPLFSDLIPHSVFSKGFSSLNSKPLRPLDNSL